MSMIFALFIDDLDECHENNRNKIAQLLFIEIGNLDLLHHSFI
jgi:hypothetical protein